MSFIICSFDNETEQFVNIINCKIFAEKIQNWKITETKQSGMNDLNLHGNKDNNVENLLYISSREKQRGREFK